MLPNVQQKTIKPIIEATVAKGSLLYTDEYDIYDRLPIWGKAVQRYEIATSIPRFSMPARAAR